MLVAIEGISGAGKTRLTNALGERLLGLGKQPILLGGFQVREYSSPITAFCRDMVSSNRFLGLPWTAEVHLLIAELIYDTSRLVLPALAEGKIVLFDGYWDSLIAFQRAIVSFSAPERTHSAMKYLDQMVALIMDFETIPSADKVIYVDCTPRNTVDRLLARDNLPVSNEHLLIQAEIARQYQSILSGKEHLVIDNNASIQWEQNVMTSLNYLISN